jgi:hypothetical protein
MSQIHAPMLLMMASGRPMAVRYDHPARADSIYALPQPVGFVGAGCGGHSGFYWWPTTLVPRSPGAPVSAQLGGLFIIVFSVLVYAWVAHNLRDIKWLKVAVWAFIIIGLLYTSGRLFSQLNFITNFIPRQISAGSLFWVWLGAMAFSQLLINRDLSWRWRIILAFGLGLMLYNNFVVL